MATADVTGDSQIHGTAPGEKGLRGGSLGLMSSIVMGMASTAPAYSLASALGFVVATVALQSPMIMLLAFVPMYMIAVAYKELNEAEPDCGTTFTWAARAFGASWGWMGGWGIFAADVIVMANLAQIAGSVRLPAGWGRQPGDVQPVGDGGRDHLDHRHDLHLVDRDRDLGQAPVSAAGHRGGHPRPAGRHGAGEGVLRQRGAGIAPHQPVVVQPL